MWKRTFDDFVTIDKRETVPFSEYKPDGIHPLVSYIGGEPTVAPHFINLMRYAHEQGNNKQYCFTNAIKLYDKKYVESLPQIGNKMVFVLSCDIYTKQSFIKKVVENLDAHGFEYAFNLVVPRTESNIEKLIAVNTMLMEYEPQEIRYRALIDQQKGECEPASNIVKFIERARGLDYDHIVDKMNWGHGSVVSQMDKEHTEDPSKGKVAIAIIPVWSHTFAEIQVKRGSFIMNTKWMNMSAECHCNSSDMVLWRVKNYKKYVLPATKKIWCVENPHVHRPKEI
jgi:MoaA/NifB/PqqE/SkfB family radical SAM enzyme